MKKIKILVITIAVLFAVVYTLNLEYFVKGVRIVYLNGESTVFIDDLKYFDYEIIESPDEKSPWKESESKTTCLLYTSDACRRIRRCRSRWSPYH